MSEIEDSVQPGGTNPGATGEHEEKFKALLHLLPIGISILNCERKPIYTNPALETILELTEEELQGGNIPGANTCGRTARKCPSVNFQAL
jgi:PAS domain-containing protein